MMKLKIWWGCVRQKNKSRNILGQPIRAYDLLRIAFDNNHEGETPNLDTDWEYFSRNHHFLYALTRIVSDQKALTFLDFFEI